MLDGFWRKMEGTFLHVRLYKKTFPRGRHFQFQKIECSQCFGLHKSINTWKNLPTFSFFGIFSSFSHPLLRVEETAQLIFIKTKKEGLGSPFIAPYLTWHKHHPPLSPPSIPGNFRGESKAATVTWSGANAASSNTLVSRCKIHSISQNHTCFLHI